jgi:hypothetical protein
MLSEVKQVLVTVQNINLGETLKPLLVVWRVAQVLYYEDETEIWY